MHDVQFTLLLAIALVVLVIFLFLRNVSATIIPSLALPMSIVGTFTVMYVLGYTIDNLSLMALTLSVGFVVDDAIVMLENIVRHMEMGEGRMEAALNGLERDRLHHRVDDPVARRGVPARALHGRRGGPAAPRVRGGDRRRRAGVGLRLPHAHAHGVQPLPAPRASPTADCTGPPSASSMGMLALYEWTLRRAMHHRRLTMAVFALTLVATAYLFMVIPKGFIPNEDTGQIFAFTEAAQDISFDSMMRHQREAAAIVGKQPYVDSFFSGIGASTHQRGPQHRAGSSCGSSPEPSAHPPTRSSRTCAGSSPASRA